jgi:topoisomerase IA-like protein
LPEAPTHNDEEDAMAKYGDKASDKVGTAMEELKAGTLKSGASGKKVTSRKQAIAIGLSEARKEGGKVPPAPAKKAAGKKAPAKKAAAKKAPAKKAAAKKAADQ